MLSKKSKNFDIKKWLKLEWPKSEWPKSEQPKSEFPQITASSMELFLLFHICLHLCFRVFIRNVHQHRSPRSDPAPMQVNLQTDRCGGQGHRGRSAEGCAGVEGPRDQHVQVRIPFQVTRFDTRKHSTTITSWEVSLKAKRNQEIGSRSCFAKGLRTLVDYKRTNLLHTVHTPHNYPRTQLDGLRPCALKPNRNMLANCGETQWWWLLALWRLELGQAVSARSWRK